MSGGALTAPRKYAELTSLGKPRSATDPPFTKVFCRIANQRYRSTCRFPLKLALSGFGSRRRRLLGREAVAVPSINIFDHDPDVQSYEAGANIFEMNDPGEVMFVVLEGSVELQRNGRVLEEVTPGGIFGEMGLIERCPRTATATTKTAVRVVPVSRRRFIYLVQNTPFFAIEVLETMARRLRVTDAQLDV
jgi:CRP/FNR family transcriptional regulator, cyclic AMP receptor protein